MLGFNNKILRYNQKWFDKVIYPPTPPTPRPTAFRYFMLYISGYNLEDRHFVPPEDQTYNMMNMTVGSATIPSTPTYTPTSEQYLGKYCASDHVLRYETDYEHLVTIDYTDPFSIHYDSVITDYNNNLYILLDAGSMMSNFVVAWKDAMTNTHGEPRWISAVLYGVDRITGPITEMGVTYYTVNTEDMYQLGHSEHACPWIEGGTTGYASDHVYWMGW